MTGDVAAAIADPVRREILLLLRSKPRSAGAIAARFPITRPAVSRHLRVLREAGVIRVETVGRQRIYLLEPAPLAELARWLEQFAPVWEQRLDALETEVHRRKRRRHASERPARQAR